MGFKHSCLPRLSMHSATLCFHMYGDAIRARSKYAAKAQKITAAILNETKFREKSPNAPSVAEEAAVETFGNGVGPEALQKASSVAQKDGER